MSVIVKSKLIEVCIDLLETPIGELCESEKFHTLFGFMTIICGCSDRSAEMGRVIVTEKLHKSILETLNKLSLDTQAMEKVDGEFICTMFSILHNTLRHNPNCKQTVRADGAIEISSKTVFLQNDDPMIKMLALFVLTFCADISSNKNLIEDTSSTIAYIVDELLKPALEYKEHKSLGGSMQCSVQEILEALSLLAENPENASRMTEQGVLGTIEQLLSGDGWKSEIEPCLNILFAMTFHTQTASMIKKNTNLVALLESIENSEKSEKNLKEASNRILWILNRSDKPAAKQQKTVAKHIMISYCHAQKLIACQIEDKLKQNGKKVWIDHKEIHRRGNIFEAMASAVNNSSHVICCISSDYENSKNCQIEATNAFEKNKTMIFVNVEKEYKSDRWLKVIMCGAYYHTILDTESLESQFWKALNVIDGQDLEEDLEQKQSRDAVDATDQFVVKSIEEQPYKHVQTWTKEGVMEWYNSTNCISSEKTKKFLDAMDGKLLCELCCWQKKTPEFFLRFVSDHLDLTSVNLIKFSCSIADCGRALVVQLDKTRV